VFISATIVGPKSAVSQTRVFPSRAAGHPPTLPLIGQALGFASVIKQWIMSNDPRQFAQHSFIVFHGISCATMVSIHLHQEAIPGQKLHSVRPGEITTKSARWITWGKTSEVFSSVSEFDHEFIVGFLLAG
jgi:hypothetical protein